MIEKTQFFEIPAAALNLSDIKIIKTRITKKNELIITVASTKEETLCHRCGSKTKPHGKGQMILLRHLPVLGMKTFIEITPPRGRCPLCDDHPTTTQRHDWYDRKSRHTKAYEKHVLLSLVNSTIADVSIKEDVGYHTIERIVDKHVDAEINWKRIKKIGILGLDEISLKKGHQDFVTIITCRIGHEMKILAVIKGRNKEDIKRFLQTIPKRLVKTIAAVCCDLYDGYINAAKEVFGLNIPVVADRFHVAKLYRKSLVSIRKQELARLRRTLSKEQYHTLKPAIAILKRKRELITREEKKILSPLFKLSPLLKAACKLCLKLTAIFNGHHRRATAQRKMEEWIALVEKSELVCFNQFIKTLKANQSEILNYFRGRQTSGFVEGFNNKIKVLKRRCYGIFNLKHLFQRLFLDTEGYGLYA